MSQPPHYRQVLAQVSERLAAAAVPSPQWDARALISYLTHIPHMSLDLEQPVPPGLELALEPLVRRREGREPLQYILGSAPFGPLDLAVGPGVFIPRPETEVLAQWAVDQLHAQYRPGMRAPVVLDLCSGSGALALYIKHYCPWAQVSAVEYSPAAAQYLARNREHTGLDIEIITGDATDTAVAPQLLGQVDLVVSNPPYVPLSEELDPEVYQDPPDAVFGGVDGMSVIRQLLPAMAQWLRPGGQMALEHDDDTADLVLAELEASEHWRDYSAFADLAGVQRFLSAWRA